MNLERMECQACKGSDSEGGCAHCGGHKYIAERLECPICKRTGWFRIGRFSFYEGKQYTSFDGLTMIAHLDEPNNCIECEEEKR